METFFSTVKNEVGERYERHGEAKSQLFGYIDVFYNQRLRHSSAGRIRPAAFERRMAHAAQLNRPRKRIKLSLRLGDENGWV